MIHELLKLSADRFKANFIQVIAESKITGHSVAGVLDKYDNLTTFDSTDFDSYTTSYTKNEVQECFIIHDYNDWSV